MQGGRGRGGPGGNPFPNFTDQFSGFGHFGGPRNLMPGLFGGNPFESSVFPSPFGLGANPFNDPFFTRPFGHSMFDSSFFGPMMMPDQFQRPFGFIGQQESAPEPRASSSRGLIIEEINSDDEKETDGQEVENPRKLRRLSNGPYIEDPDDVAEETETRQLRHVNNYDGLNHNRQSQPQSRSFTFQSSSVTYGGTNGAYYTSSRTRRSGSDGVTIEETKEADTSTRQATHKISRGLYNKGHSLTRKLKSDGNVDTMQTLHNLNEDELPIFNEAFHGAAKDLPIWDRNKSYEAIGSGNNGRGSLALPSIEYNQRSGQAMVHSRDDIGSSASKSSGDLRDRNGNSRGRPKN